MMSDAEEGSGESAKPLFWVGSSKRDLREFPAEVRQAMGFALWQAQNGDKHVHAKVLKGFGGAGVLEVVENDEAGTNRAVYTVKFAGAVYVLHAFQKKSKRGIKTPQSDLEAIKSGLQAAKEHDENWHSEQGEED
jgi:phage-related protein